MTAVTLAADAPRAASAISSSSTRCSCTGGTSGWIRNTSRSLQLDLQAVVGEPHQADRLLRHAEPGADLGGQPRVRAAAENDDLTHRRCPACLPACTAAGAGIP